tara:strand:+ start:790 stop:1692 length:903 start_codon:yes stop_codon:yes gene_type:complete
MANNTNLRPLVSIIINCFNGQRFLSDALTSIVNQTYKNWEIIFWDNQSKDNSKKIFFSFKDKRFKYFYANKHTVLYEARNLAIKKAKGKYISFLDTDDVWENNKLATQIPLFKNNDIAMVYSNIWIGNSELKRKKIHIKKKQKSGLIYENLIENYNIPIISTILRSSILKKFKKKFDKKLSVIGDFEFFLRISKRFKIVYIHDPLAIYRLHGNNYSSLNKFKEIEEFQAWLKSNKKELNRRQFTSIKSRINDRKFLYFKINGKYKKCFKLIIEKNYFSHSLKNIFILITPNFLLKKLLRY